METIIIQSEGEKLNKIKDFLSSLNIHFISTQEMNGDLYDMAFVQKILRREKNAEIGNTIEIDPENLWESIGLK